ncbi:MAG: hypothetical protein K9J06_11240 [Flavobacteriales bacterium]|nr:hypothetical protein [Flavobacteriales bacterium]
MKRTIQTSIGEVSLLEHGLIYTRAFKNTEVGLSAAQEYHEAVAYLCEDGPHCSILDISGVTYLSKEAREWMSETSSVWGRTISAAIIADSFTAKTIGNLFIKLSRPSYPVRIFEDFDSAEIWAKKNFKTFMACQEELG